MFRLIGCMFRVWAFRFMAKDFGSRPCITLPVSENLSDGSGPHMASALNPKP